MILVLAANQAIAQDYMKWRRFPQSAWKFIGSIDDLKEFYGMQNKVWCISLFHTRVDYMRIIEEARARTLDITYYT